MFRALVYSTHSYNYVYVNVVAHFNLFYERCKSALKLFVKK